MPDFSRRATEPEWMDGEDVPQAEFAACMRDLAQVNTLTLARRPTLAFVDAALRAGQGQGEATRPLTVLDIGFGAGDMLRAIHRLCERRGRAARLVGFDLNPRSEPVARAATPEGMVIEYRTGDAFDWPVGEPLDLVVSSLVTHHMSEAEIRRFLAWMEQRTRLGWLVNDLHRHPLPYYGFSLMAGAMRWHRFVRHDGPLSIARAFTRADWEARLAAAGIGGAARIEWWFPFRFCLWRARW